MSQSTIRIFGCQLLYWYFFNFSFLNFSNPSFFLNIVVVRFVKQQRTALLKIIIIIIIISFLIPVVSVFYFLLKKMDIPAYTSPTLCHGRTFNLETSRACAVSSHQAVAYQFSLWMSTSFPSNTNWLKAAKTSMTYWTYLVNYH